VNADAGEEDSPPLSSSKVPSEATSLYAQAGEEATVEFGALSQVDICENEGAEVEAIIQEEVEPERGVRVSEAVESACGKPLAEGPETQQVDEAVMPNVPDGGPMACVFVTESLVPAVVNVRYHVSHA